MNQVRRTKEVFRVSAPGKIILFGDHAVVYNKKALASAIDLRAWVELFPLSSSSTEGLIQLELCLQNVEPSPDRIYNWTWSQIISLYKRGKFKEVISSLTKDNRNTKLEYTGHIESFAFQDGIQPMEGKLVQTFILHCLLLLDWDYLEHFLQSGINWGWKWRVTSDIPLGVGLGSSAAINVAIVSSIMCMDESRDKIPLTLTWDLSSRHKINHWSFVGERYIHLTPSGIDNTISTFGGSLVYQKNLPTQFLSNQELFKELNFIILNTGIHRSTGNVLNHVRQLVQQHPDILSSIFDTIHNISCHAVQVLTTLTDKYKMLKDLQWLIRANHNMLLCLDIVHPVLNDFIAHLTKDNSLAGKVTGAGQGGCFLLLATDSSEIDKLQYAFPSFSFYSVSLGQPGVCIEK